MVEIHMSYLLKSDSEILAEPFIEICDGQTNDYIIAALLGFNKKIYDDTGIILYGTPLGPLDEYITFTSEIELKLDGDEVLNLGEIEIKAQRFLVIEGLKGMRDPLNEHLIDFISKKLFP